MNKLGEKPSDEELEDMIRAVDLNGDGEIDFEEFISLMRLRMDERQRDPEADLRDAFDMFDTDRSGYIDRDEVRALMKKLAQTLTDEEIDAIMEEVCSLFVLILACNLGNILLVSLDFFWFRLTPMVMGK
jgi:calmodulin